MDTSNEIFVIILLIIVVAIIVRTAPDFQTGVMRVSVVVYVVMLYRHICKIRNNGKDSKKTCDVVCKGSDLSDDLSNDLSNDIDPIDINAIEDIYDVDSTEDVGDGNDGDANDDANANANADAAVNNIEDYHERIHNDYYNSEGRIYNTAKSRYTSCHPPPSYENDQAQMYAPQSLDEENTRQVRERNRNKRSIDGYVSKTADYFKIHYAREFDSEEAKNGWWGNYNYGETQF